MIEPAVMREEPSMERKNTLTERIAQRFEQHRQSLAGEQQQLDSMAVEGSAVEGSGLYIDRSVH